MDNVLGTIAGPLRMKLSKRAGDPFSDAKKREVLRSKLKDLEKEIMGEDVIADKVALHDTISYMRRQRELCGTDIDLAYPVQPPYSFVEVSFDQKEGEYRYYIREPRLTAKDVGLIEDVKRKMEATMDQEEIPNDEGNVFCRSPKMSAFIKRRYLEVLDLFDISVEQKRNPIYLYYIERDLIGLSRCDVVLNDPFVEDVSCNGAGLPLFVYHRVFGSMKTNVVFPDDIELNRFVVKLAQVSGRHVSIYQPILDATLCDGSRINLTLGSEVTKRGSTFTVRKFSYDPISPIDLIKFGSVSSEQLAYFWTLIENKRSMLVSGGTASGKTTLMNALCMFIRPEDTIVSIEDTPEIPIEHTNWIQSVSRSGYGMAGSGGSNAGGASGISSQGGSIPGSITLFDLLVAALRQRPEYIIVGEVRGKEAFTLFQAIAVGHASMGTIHAGGIDELMHRIENEPMNIPRVLFQSLDAVAFQGQVIYNGRRVRRVKSVSEVLEIEPTTNDLLTNEVFAWNPYNDRFEYNGHSYVLESIAKETGRPVDRLMSEMARKKFFLDEIHRLGISYYKDVSDAIGAYYVDPENAFAELTSKKHR